MKKRIFILITSLLTFILLINLGITANAQEIPSAYEQGFEVRGNWSRNSPNYETHQIISEGHIFGDVTVWSQTFTYYDESNNSMYIMGLCKLIMTPYPEAKVNNQQALFQLYPSYVSGINSAKNMEYSYPRISNIYELNFIACNGAISLIIWNASNDTSSSEITTEISNNDPILGVTSFRKKFANYNSGTADIYNKSATFRNAVVYKIDNYYPDDEPEFIFYTKTSTSFYWTFGKKSQTYTTSIVEHYYA